MDPKLSCLSNYFAKFSWFVLVYILLNSAIDMATGLGPLFPFLPIIEVAIKFIIVFFSFSYGT